MTDEDKRLWSLRLALETGFAKSRNRRVRYWPINGSYVLYDNGQAVIVRTFYGERYRQA